MYEPPFDAGGSQSRFSAPAVALACNLPGGCGGPGVATGALLVEALAPTALVAVTVKTYSVASARPSTTASVASPGAVTPSPPGFAVIEYERIELPSSMLACHVTIALRTPA